MEPYFLYNFTSIAVVMHLISVQWYKLLSSCSIQASFLLIFRLLFWWCFVFSVPSHWGWVPAWILVVDFLDYIWGFRELMDVYSFRISSLWDSWTCWSILTLQSFASWSIIRYSLNNHGGCRHRIRITDQGISTCVVGNWVDYIILILVSFGRDIYHVFYLAGFMHLSSVTNSH